MTEEELRALVATPYERGYLEFKGPGSRASKAFLARIARATLGMANRRDGGIVIIGVSEEATGKPVLVGLNPEEASSWAKYDDVAQSINEYADPSVQFDLATHVLDGKHLAVLVVREFSDLPVLCARSFESTLSRGYCYVRSHHKNETASIPSQEDMRELLDLAIDKGIRRFLGRAQSSGILHAKANSEPSDAEKYQKQRGSW
jgi:predicted HTH transcriptional regulator